MCTTLLHPNARFGEIPSCGDTLSMYVGALMLLETIGALPYRNAGPQIVKIETGNEKYSPAKFCDCFVEVSRVCN